MLVGAGSVLGVCLGMQIMAKFSEEGRLPGLGYLQATVKKISFHQKSNLYLPHIGWNVVQLLRTNSIFKGLTTDSMFYFLHSYYLDCQHTVTILAKAKYGHEFVCAVNEGNIFGVQFYPAKSHKYGIQLLENFAKL